MINTLRQSPGLTGGAAVVPQPMTHGEGEPGCGVLLAFRFGVMPRVSTLLSQTLVYMVGLAASRGIAILLVPLYTRQLSEAEFFTWDLSTTTILFILAAAELGMSSALPRFYIKADTDAERRAVAQTATATAVLSALIGVALLLTLRGPAATLVFGDGSTANLIDLIALTVALTVFSNLPLSLLRAQERPYAFAAVCIMRAVVGPACIIALVVHFDMGVRGILLGDAAGLAAVGLAGIVLNRTDLLPRFHPSALRDLLSFGFPLVPIGIASTIVLVSDRYFLREFVDPANAATYTLGFKIATIVNLVTMGLQTAWAPTAFRIAKLDDAPRILADSFKIIYVALGFLALCTTACALELSQIFSPAGSYVGAESIVPWIAFSFALQACVLVVNTNVLIANKTALSTSVFCIGALAKIILALLLIPRFGIQGAAASTLLSYLTELIVVFYFVRLVYPVPYNTSSLIAVSLLLAASAVALTMATALDYWVSVPIRIALLLALVLALIVTGVLNLAKLRAIFQTSVARGTK